MHDAVRQMVPLDNTVYEEGMPKLISSKIVHDKAPRIICHVFFYNI